MQRRERSTQRKEEAHTEEALRSSEQETAARFLADSLQLLNSDRRNSGKEPLWLYDCMEGR